MVRNHQPARDETLARVAGRISKDDADIDRTLADSFPASDPPPWTLGVMPARETDETTHDDRHRDRQR